MVAGVILTVLSAIAVVSAQLIQRFKSKKFPRKIIFYQGCFGLLAFYMGVYSLISDVIIGSASAIAAVWLTMLAVNLTLMVLGIVLSYVMILQYVFAGSHEVKQKGDEMLRAMVPWQLRFGLTGLIIGLWCQVFLLLI